MRIFKVWSDDFNGEMFEEKAYKELTLQMSTGDFHTHIAIEVIGKYTIDNVILLGTFLVMTGDT